MKVRSAILIALLLSGCQNLNNQDDRTQTANKSVSTQHKKVAKRGLKGASSDKNLWVLVSDEMSLEGLKHPRVQKQRQELLRNPAHFSLAAQQAEPYLYLIAAEIERRGLPMELVAIPMVESTFNPAARSANNAAGLWQMMPRTGKNMGLELNNWYDGRKDVMASTNAALDYFEYLNKMFDGNWLHTIAAYNSGEGTVQKAIKRNKKRGKSTDFWSLDLPAQTEHYVPKVLAMSDMIRNYDRYGIALPNVPNEPQVKLVNVGNQVDIKRVANLAGMSSGELKELNPAFSRGMTAPRGSHHLLVPVEYVDDLNAALKNPAAKKLAKASTTNSSERSSAKSKKSSVTGQQHVVRSGDNLWNISRAHGVSHQELARLNGISTKTVLKLGTKLKLPM